ncbi:MAG: DUF2178 domain-containing protein [Candidatus Paceibacterota bacterium]|jgi:uncharacterized membrane protein
MSKKQFKIIQICIAVILALIFSQSIILENYFIPIIAVLIGLGLLLWLKTKVKDVLADERDWQIGGKSAILSLQIFSGVMVPIIFVLYILKDTNPTFEPIAMALSFSVVFIMLLYSLIFTYLSKYKFGDKKSFYLSLAVFILLISFLLGMRFIK